MISTNFDTKSNTLTQHWTGLPIKWRAASMDRARQGLISRCSFDVNSRSICNSSWRRDFTLKPKRFSSTNELQIFSIFFLEFTCAGGWMPLRRCPAIRWYWPIWPFEREWESVHLRGPIGLWRKKRPSFGLDLRRRRRSSNRDGKSSVTGANPILDCLQLSIENRIRWTSNQIYKNKSERATTKAKHKSVKKNRVRNQMIN